MNTLIVLSAIAVVPVAFVLCYYHPRFAWSAFLASMLLPMLQFGVDGRPAAVFVVVTQIAASRLRIRGALRGACLRTWQGYLCLVILFIATLVWSVDRGRTVEALSAWFVILVAVPVFMARLVGRTMVRITVGVVFVVVAASAAIVLIGLPSGFVGGRAVGLMTNANGLGVLCGLLVPMVLAGRHWKTAVVVIPMVSYLIVMSQSRGGMLAAGVGLAIFVWMKAGHLGRLLTLPVAVIAGVWIAQWDFWSVSRSEGLIRTYNSRSTEWALLIKEFRERPWVGSGYGTQDGLGSSYLKLAAELGMLGIAAGCCVLAILVVSSWRSTVTLPTLAAALTNGIFEGWLLAAGSAYAVILVVVVVAGLDPRDSVEVGTADRHIRTAREARARPDWRLTAPSAYRGNQLLGLAGRFCGRLRPRWRRQIDPRRCPGVLHKISESGLQASDDPLRFADGHEAGQRQSARDPSFRPTRFFQTNGYLA